MIKVTLDPGHGGQDPGNVQPGTREKDVTLALAIRTAHYLRLLSEDASGASQVAVQLTRSDDTFVGIDARAKMAVNQGSQAFVAIHDDAAPVDPAAEGCSAYVAPQGHIPESEALSKAILSRLDAVGLRSRGVQYDTATHVGRLGVLRGTSRWMAATLIETGFATNQHDRDLLTHPDSQEVIAIAIAGAILAYFGIKARMELLGK